MSAGAEDRYFLHFVGVAQEETTWTDPAPPRHYLDPFVHAMFQTNLGWGVAAPKEPKYIAVLYGP